MRSVKGAIDKIMVTEKKIEYRVVGQTKARGICGSGVIDLISGLLKLQIIKPDGRLIDKEECPEGISQEIKRRIIKEKIGNKFLIISSEESATGKPIYLTQKDIREVQLAKGAISAGINVLLKYTHLEPKDLDEILLAGSFGNVLDINSALIIGLIPEICSKKILSIGNAAGRGATKLLLSKDMRDIAENLSRKIQYVELSAQSDFSRFFFDSMLFSPIDLN